MAKAASAWLGTPYRHQASAKGQGTDCLGLLRGIWRELLGEEPEKLPPYTPRWTVEIGEPLLEAAQRFLLPAPGHQPCAGQVLLFRMVVSGPVKHCGIAISSGYFIHAYDGRAVTMSRYSRWWTARLEGLFDYPDKEEIL
ncbi:MAG: NlpC/P60 family protein [Pseudomonadota bacterium]